MFAYISVYVDGVGAIGAGISCIGESIPVPALIIKDLQDLIER